MMPNKKLKRLDSVEAVFNILGGTYGVCDVTDVPYRVGLNWKNLYNRFPARTYVAIQDALRARGYIGADRLWGMIDAEQ